MSATPTDKNRTRFFGTCGEEVFVRCANPADLDALSRAESECFPPAEAAARETLADRLATYPGHFLLLFSQGRLAAYVNGPVVRGRNLEDYMYADASVHDGAGDWQMIFGLGTLPAFRGRGYASALMRRFIAVALSEGRLGVVLTCKPGLVNFYSSFGFADEGVCNSEHGGAVWHRMRLAF